MQNANGFRKREAILASAKPAVPQDLHPAWRAFVEYCRNLRHGDIEKLRIQDGLPVIAEVTRHKVKFTS